MKSLLCMLGVAAFISAHTLANENPENTTTEPTAAAQEGHPAAGKKVAKKAKAPKGKKGAKSETAAPTTEEHPTEAPAEGAGH